MAKRAKQHLTAPLLKCILRFGVRVVSNFFRNHGVLLAGGVGFNVLLSAVPLFAVLSVGLSQIVDEQRLLGIMAVQARHLSPAHAGVLLDAVRALVDSGEVVGIVGVASLLFFSSFAFRMLEESIAIIFHQPEETFYRSFWVSALLPYGFMMVLGVAFMALTILSGAASTLNELSLAFFDRSLPFAWASGSVLYLLSFFGMFGLFSAIYKVMPVVQIELRRALVGGFVAALLWELVRLGLGYYFAHLSPVNAMYGSLATIVVLLLSLEMGAVILLLGAQVIAELERSARAGQPWHWQPGDPLVNTDRS